MKQLRDSIVAIIGLGLMGGSLALALRARHACAQILAIDRDAATRALARSRGVVDEASDSLDLAARADVIVLALPVRAIIERLPRIGALAREGALVMDLGSTKEQITRALEQLPAHLEPIGGHPMCGKEISGFNAADATLFQNAAFVLTPLKRTAPQAIALAASLVTCLGGHPAIVDATRHDKLVAVTSHLPFMLAAALVSVADDRARDDDLLFALAANGFRDTARLAASDTQTMLDILLTNRANVASAMREYARRFEELALAVGGADAMKLRDILEQAAERRRRA